MAPIGGVRSGIISAARDTIPDSGLLHEYDAQSQSFVDQDSISTLVDQEGSKDLSGTCTGVTNGINGYPSFDYDGTDDEHTDDSPIGWGSNNIYTMAAVVKIRTIGLNGEPRTFVSNGSGDGTEISTDDTEGDEWRVNQNESGNLTRQGSVSTDTTYIVIATYDGSTFTVDVNDSNIVSISEDNSTPSNDFTIGSRNGSNYADVQIGHYLQYDQYYNESERTELYNALADKWGF